MLSFGKFPQHFFSHRGAVWQATIGLEIHAQLKLKTKLFSPGSTDSQKNSALGLLDISLPGTLPRLNRRAIDQAVKAALALNCEINLMSHFDRKHYFYLDMPLGFQITQQDRPLGHSGSLSFRCPDENGTAVTSQVAVQRLQVEQDSAKSIHDMHDLYSLIDFSRAGSALVEVVFSPSLRTPKQAASVLATAQQLLRHIDVCNGNMEDGSMRCDVNVSVARYEDNSGDGSQPRVLTQGGRVEVKNLSSLQRVETAATYEIGRHIDLLLAGEAIPRETRGFDATTEKTFSLRAKEDAVDYRFFPDPDLPPLVISPEELDQYRVNMPELPEETISRIMDVYKLNDYQVSVLFSLQVLRRFEAAIDMVDSTKKEKLAAIMFNWITTDLAGVCSFNNMSIDEFPITVTQIYDIVCSIEQEQLTSQQIKKILICLFEDEKLRSMSVQEIASKLGLVKVSDEAVLKNLCLQAINDPKNAKELSKYRSGRLGMFNYFFGEVMKNSRGQADPIVVRSLLHSLLD